MNRRRPPRALNLPQRTLLILRHEIAAGVTVGAGAVAGVVWSALSESNYRSVIDARVSSSWLRSWDLDSLRHVSVNGAMTIFFFAVGLELSKEIRTGSLRERHQAVLPVLAALGGMVACATIYFAFGATVHNAKITSGWGVPMATDIAFTLGALSMMGRRIPRSLRTFLLALAVADDLFAVIVLAFSSHQRSSAPWLLGFAGVVVATFVLRRHLGPWQFVVALALAWLTLVLAHVEPALAGVAIGMVVPFAPRSPGHRLERMVQPWSNAVALPLFALCACGVAWSKVSWSPHGTEIVLGLVGARIIGKVLGISLTVSLARRFGVPGPSEIRGALIWAASALCAIGFTVPLLFAGALYGTASSPYAESTVGLLMASLLAAAFGLGALRVVRRNA